MGFLTKLDTASKLIPMAVTISLVFMAAIHYIDHYIEEQLERRIDVRISVVTANVTKTILVEDMKYLLRKEAAKIAAGDFQDVGKVTIERIFLYEVELLELRPSLEYELSVVTKYYNEHFR